MATTTLSDLNTQYYLFRLIGEDKTAGRFGGPLGSEMSVLPNTTHFTVPVNADLFGPITNLFLDVKTSKQRVAL